MSIPYKKLPLSQTHIDTSLLTMPFEQLPDTYVSPRAIPTKLNFGTHWAFLHAGDFVPLHEHPEGASHYTIVMQGIVAYQTEDSNGLIDAQIWDAPALFRVPCKVRHGFVSKSNNAIIINIKAALCDPETIAVHLERLNIHALKVHDTVKNLVSLTV
jgi:hypothetical protein